MILFLVFVSFLAGFLVMDLVAWLLGRQTMSQWVIAESRRSKWIRFYFLCVILVTMVFLCFHFELVS
jgi:hypothetical protein